jgi:hypothetical protein
VIPRRERLFKQQQLLRAKIRPQDPVHGQVTDPSAATTFLRCFTVADGMLGDKRISAVTATWSKGHSRNWGPVLARSGMQLPGAFSYQATFGSFGVP